MTENQIEHSSLKKMFTGRALDDVSGIHQGLV